MARPPRQPRQSASARDYEDCIVSFIDILGFSSLVETRDPADVYDILQLFHRTNSSDDVPTHRIQEVRVQPRLFVSQISDAVVRVVTIDTQYHSGSLFWELFSLALVQLDLIASGVLIRGGMTMGEVAIGYNGEGPVFGPAFNRAFRIEQEEAIYPRIVVDATLVERVLTDERLGSELNSRQEDYDHVQGLLGIGEDGTYFLDYLRTVQPDSDIDLVGFLARQARLVVEAPAGMSRRTARKFAWLRQYHNAFVAEFRDQLDRDSEGRADDLLIE